jgi:hypothetical protein
LLPCASAPIAFTLVRRLAAANDGPAHNQLLASTAKLLLVVGILLTLGVVLGHR